MTEATLAAQPVPDVATPAPAVTPAPVATPSPSPESAPVVGETAPTAPSTTPAAPAPGADTPTPEAAPAAEAPKPEEPKPEGEAKPEGETAEVKPAYAFKMPEGVVAEAPIMSAYENILTKLNVSPEGGQELLDFHAERIKAAADHIRQSDQDAYSKMRQGWVKDFQKQYGNRQDTVLADAKWAVAQFGGDKKQQAELWGVLNMTGAGDHPAVIRAFANIAKAHKERSAPQHGVQPKAVPSDPAERRYGKRV